MAAPHAQPDLFGSPPREMAADLPEGFRYRAELISAAEEQALLAWFETLDLKPFEFQGYLGHREVTNFGWRYDYSERALRGADALPPQLEGLRHAAGTFAGVEPGALRQALVTRYGPGVTIGWHRDRPDFEVVVGVSLKSRAVFRLRRRDVARWERRSLTVEPRSAEVMQGAARDEWEHSIRPVEAERYSVTFRTLRER